MEFRLLGKLEVDADGIDLTPIRPQQRTVLGLLLLRAGEIVRSDELVDALWGERAPMTARTALHGHISALRKRLGAERIETRAPGYLLRLGPEDEIDVRRFERMTAEARANGPALRAEQLREALALFRGEPLADYPDDWFARAESHRLTELRLATVEERVEADLQLGRHMETLPELERLVVQYPHRERLHAQLMVALYRAGRQAEALAAFGEARRVLVDELGIEPSPALRRLERRILNQDAELAAPDVFCADQAGRRHEVDRHRDVPRHAGTAISRSRARSSGSSAAPRSRSASSCCSSPSHVRETPWEPRSASSEPCEAQSGSASIRERRRSQRNVLPHAGRQASAARHTPARSCSRRRRATCCARRRSTTLRFATSASTA